ncbi:pyruvate dehydrogenase [Streptomyces pluripotens]|uniref:Pyruvate dehydrogenase n=1 Tax=Streptomyces pluripotens TaxID=1355015 RepID=A0A221P9A7_9ACTN|nr:thiamine pyrophosphate-dependent dehydrogenase E1 component subunit alpha [Streptomyces pluripotens]ARP74592.1 pyruvate dehydrogenase [Streptomyces pluripotens]ASN28869.1 pyruvate dehydrogenase [Streptomyces pluripotens]
MTGTVPPLATPAARYRMMRLIREFDTLALEWERSGTIPGGVHPCIGQEAVAVGTCAALRPNDRITSTHRGHGHVLAKGADPARLLAELAGRATGLNRGRGGSMHAADLSLGILGANGMVGAGAAIAAGAAWAARRRGQDTVVISFFGDGALNQGVLLESLNLAALHRAPVVFVCENNGYATTLAAAEGIAGSATGRAAAFGIPAVTVDGMDVDAVRTAVAEAVARARAGAGPGFVECLTYRFEGHHTMERRLRLCYRTSEEVDSWRARDPLDRARPGPEEADSIDVEVAGILRRAADWALEQERPDPATAGAYTYAGGPAPRPGVPA